MRSGFDEVEVPFVEWTNPGGIGLSALHRPPILGDLCWGWRTWAAVERGTGPPVPEVQRYAM